MTTDFQLNLPSARLNSTRPTPTWIEASPVRLVKLKRGLIHRSLLYCLEKGYFSLIRFLIESGHGNINERDHEGRSVLIYCTFINDDSWAESIAMMLLEYGARMADSDKRGLNAIHYAIKRQRVVLVRRFLDSLDVNLHQSVDMLGNTCLHHACSTGNLEIVQLILLSMKKYLIDLTSKNKAGLTAYDIACRQNHVDCQSLLREEFLSQDQQDQSRMTFLTSLVSQTVNEESNESRRSAGQLSSSRRRASTVTSHPGGSFGSAVSYLVNSSMNRRRSQNASMNINENSGNQLKLHLDPLQSRLIALKHNPSLDESLTSQFKQRDGFTPSTAITSSTTPSKIPINNNNWRSEFAKVYWQLQTYKTASYRPSVQSLSRGEFITNMCGRNSSLGSSTKLDMNQQQGSNSASTSSLNKVTTQQRNSVTSTKPLGKPKKVNFN